MLPVPKPEPDFCDLGMEDTEGDAVGGDGSLKILTTITINLKNNFKSYI